MKKWLLTGLAVVVVALIVAAVSFFAITPGRIEQLQNRVVPVQLGITPAAQALQATLDVADLHADSLLWKRDLLERSDRGHVDLPRLIEGRYALQVFSSVTKSPKGRTTTPTAPTPTRSRAWPSSTCNRCGRGPRCCNARYGMRKN